MKKISNSFFVVGVFCVKQFCSNRKNGFEKQSWVAHRFEYIYGMCKDWKCWKFYSLFQQEPVIWIGVYKEQSQQSRVLKDNIVKIRISVPMITKSLSEMSLIQRITSKKNFTTLLSRKMAMRLQLPSITVSGQMEWRKIWAKNHGT